MSLFMRGASGTIDPADLATVHELCAAVRGWLSASADAQKNEHITANLPYADLMFAFSFATLGDDSSANTLLEDARRVLVVPVPKAWNDNRTFEATVCAVVSNFLFGAFRYRVQQVSGSESLSGPLSAELLADREVLATYIRAGGTNNPHLRAAFVIDSFRSISRIVEPEEQVDPYAFWVKSDAAKAPTNRPACARHARQLPPNGVNETSAPDLDATWRQLLGGNAMDLSPSNYTELARAYVTALGHAGGAGLAGMIELFREMNPKWITNTWTTAQYYSRFHIMLIEDTVFAACRVAREKTAP